MLPVLTTGQLFLHSWRHFFGLHLSLLTMAIRVNRSDMLPQTLWLRRWKSVQRERENVRGVWLERSSGKEYRKAKLGLLASSCNWNRVCGSGSVSDSNPIRIIWVKPNVIYSELFSILCWASCCLSYLVGWYREFFSHPLHIFLEDKKKHNFFCFIDVYF